MFLFNIVFAVLAKAVRQEKYINGIQKGNKLKVALSVNYMIQYQRDPQILENSYN